MTEMLDMCSLVLVNDSYYQLENIHYGREKKAVTNVCLLKLTMYVSTLKDDTRWYVTLKAF